METVDLNKLETAITYVGRIADGRNPVNNASVQEESVLNNPNVIRCMYFIKEVLEELRRNGGVIGGRKPKAGQGPVEPFPFEVLEAFRYEKDQTITHVLRQIYAPLAGREVKKISARMVTDWMRSEGYLASVYRDDLGKEATAPTEKGEALGIYTEVRNMSGNAYLAVIYNQKAQEFVVQNLEKIVNGMQHNEKS